MICFEAQTAIVNPSKERPVWHWGIHSFGNDFLLAGSTFGWNVVGDPALTFIRHFICFFPHANCSTWSYTDRFGLENVNSQIRETNRQLQRWGNNYNILKLWTVCVCVCMCVKDCGWTTCLSVDAFARAPLYLWVRLRSCVGIYTRMSAVQTKFPTVVPAGVCHCCVSVRTTDSDFHSQRPTDGPYMCQPLQKITNPPQLK